MKKRLLALAVGSAFVAPAAMAQTSNVVLSGQIKLGYEYLMPDDANLGNGSTAGLKSYDTSRVANETSFVRFSGSEDLGNGLRAVFQIESDVGGDRQGGFFASRNTGAGLSSNAFGTIMFGRWDTHYLSHAGVEGAGLGGTSLALKANSLNIITWVNGLGTAGDRLSNVIRYVTPNWAGFEAEGIYSFDGENTRTGGIDGRQNGRAAEWAATLRYNAGPINAFGSYINRKNQAIELANYANAVGALGTSPSAQESVALASAIFGGNSGNAIPLNMGTLDMDAFRLGFAWTFSLGASRLKLGLIYDYNSWDAKVANNTATTEAKRDAWSVPLSVGFGPHTFFGTWAMANDAKGNRPCAAEGAGGSILGPNPPGFTVGCTGGDSGAMMYMLGYDYALSKRTSVGGNWVMIDNDSRGYYDFWSRGVGVSRAGRDPQSFYVGLRHLF